MWLVRCALILSVLSSFSLAQDSDDFGFLGSKKPDHDWPVAGRLKKGHARPPAFIHNNATVEYTFGLTPARVAHAYGFDAVRGTTQGAGQTIAIISAYDNAAIEADLGVFSTRFDLPVCTTSNGCFQKLYAAGVKPAAEPSWALESALDVEWAHAIAPKAKILLVEAATASFPDLFAAVDLAVMRGASVVSMSWSSHEFPYEMYFDSHFNVRNVTFIAASGDNGTGAEYPAAAHNVLGVGGTTLNLTDADGSYGSETAWKGSGGGMSLYLPRPSYQDAFQIHIKRGVPDVAYGADPATGFAVYSSTPFQDQSGWFQMGGTSAGAPQWAALVAIANSMRAAEEKAPLNVTNFELYRIAVSDYAGSFHDVTVGTNGSCGSACKTGLVYDSVTGLGSPKANHLIPLLANLP